ncbi:hypothetical protein LPJ73_007446 [Coemansia sp. RSA 2703]|nr:hypothetical protein LPJ73_007446 [Coemansia sp. RSA 2703]KAJ2361939.1 hypothetical protein IW150_007126 [Coemansia sp. RSA 2607]
MQILDRFLTSTTAGHIKKRIYHYAFVSLMIAVEEVHGYIMLTKQFRRHVSKLCKNETIENYKQEVLKTLMGVVSVPTTNDLLIATLQIAAYEYPSVFGARDMLDQISEIRHKGLSLDPMPFLFNYSLIVDACKLAATVTTNRNCQGIAESMLASACFYIIAENRFKLDTDKAGICARHSYEEVAGIVNYIKMII